MAGIYLEGDRGSRTAGEKWKEDWEKADARSRTGKPKGFLCKTLDDIRAKLQVLLLVFVVCCAVRRLQSAFDS